MNSTCTVTLHWKDLPYNQLRCCSYIYSHLHVKYIIIYKFVKICVLLGGTTICSHDCQAWIAGPTAEVDTKHHWSYGARQSEGKVDVICKFKETVTF